MARPPSRDHSSRRAGALGGATSDDPAPTAPTILDATAVSAALGALLSSAHPGVSRQEGEALLTDAAATLLGLERTRLSAKLRRKAALLDVGIRHGAEDEAARLALAQDEIERHIDELRSLTVACRERLQAR